MDRHQHAPSRGGRSGEEKSSPSTAEQKIRPITITCTSDKRLAGPIRACGCRGSRRPRVSRSSHVNSARHLLLFLCTSPIGLVAFHFAGRRSAGSCRWVSLNILSLLESNCNAAFVLIVTCAVCFPSTMSLSGTASSSIQLTQHAIADEESLETVANGGTMD